MEIVHMNERNTLFTIRCSIVTGLLRRGDVADVLALSVFASGRSTT